LSAVSIISLASMAISSPATKPSSPNNPHTIPSPSSVYTPTSTYNYSQYAYNANRLNTLIAAKNLKFEANYNNYNNYAKTDNPPLSSTNVVYQNPQHNIVNPVSAVVNSSFSVSSPNQRHKLLDKANLSVNTNLNQLLYDTSEGSNSNSPISSNSPSPRQLAINRNKLKLGNNNIRRRRIGEAKDHYSAKNSHQSQSNRLLSSDLEISIYITLLSLAAFCAVIYYVIQFH
jgi:hypothetical protein